MLSVSLVREPDKPALWLVGVTKMVETEEETCRSPVGVTSTCAMPPEEPVNSIIGLLDRSLIRGLMTMSFGIMVSSSLNSLT